MVSTGILNTFSILEENLYKVSRPTRKNPDEQAQEAFVEVIDLLIISLLHFGLVIIWILGSMNMSTECTFMQHKRADEHWHDTVQDNGFHWLSNSIPPQKPKSKQQKLLIYFQHDLFLEESFDKCSIMEKTHAICVWIRYIYWKESVSTADRHDEK